MPIWCVHWLSALTSHGHFPEVDLFGGADLRAMCEGADKGSLVFQGVVEAAEACAVVIEAVACAAEVEEVVEAKLSQSLKVNWMLSLMPITTKLLVEVIQPPHKTGL